MQCMFTPRTVTITITSFDDRRKVQTSAMAITRNDILGIAFRTILTANVNPLDSKELNLLKTTDDL